MSQYSAYYSILQYCPHPERFEAINVGVVLRSQDSGQEISVRVVRSGKRVEQVFGNIVENSFLFALNSFCNRVRDELSKPAFKNSFSEFANKRANQFRVTPLKPVYVSDLEAEADLLFDKLVGEPVKHQRRPAAKSKLKKIFDSKGVLPLLDQKPEIVVLPEYDLKIKAAFGYQNGSYNLIDAVNMTDRDSAKVLKEAGERALEGSLLFKHFAHLPNDREKKKLIVVADFGSHPFKLFQDVRDILKNDGTKLYRMDEIDGLIDNISANKHVH